MKTIEGIGEFHGQGMHMGLSIQVIGIACYDIPILL
jgi:hypothetical protein